ncbi:DNA-binding response regulator [Pseudanabaena sp. FACHB-2040]|uniref:response regulator transcription factor n=1 Tax=Pseudanabaena sp. FACHB-2040 TaxID=2692859 RepID=UPI0016894181|nr:DNA-binding response regulator [Pseudanabaena sp. FACHB-2040]MBD2256621.1 DNA-binding response regulator [Pseudanabaena sp. FACHB-2040]
MKDKTLGKILVIEGQRQVRDLFARGLKAQGFTPITADSGRVGIQQAKQHLPALITCSIVMPDVAGYDVLKILRRSPATAVIPFIFVADKDDRTELRKAMELGASDCLTKPCTVEELIRAISAQFQKQDTLQQWYESQAQPSSELSPAGNVSLATASAPTPALEWIFPSDSSLSEVFHFIEANYYRPITLSDVAEAAGYSPAYLTNLIGRQTGQTVQQWIIARRMAAARSLLLETNQSVERIAAQVGYQHSVHFFRQFRQCHGVTPSSWRSTQRRSNPMQY